MKLRFQISWIAMVLALAVLAATYRMIGHLGASGPLAIAMTNTTQFQIWRLICSLTAACAVALGAQTWVNLFSLQQDFGWRWRELLIGALVLGIVFLFAYFAFDRREIYGFRPGWPPIPAHQTIGAILGLCFCALGVPAAGGMGLVQEFLNESMEGPTPLPQRVQQFLRLKNALDSFVTLCAMGIAVYTLPVGAWRRVVLAVEPGMRDTFPSEIVVLFGLYWTFFLALGYVPVYAKLADVGGKIRDEMVPMPDDRTGAGMAEWHTKRTIVSQLLGIEAGSIENLKTALSTLAPLIGSILSVVVGDAK